MKSGVAERQSDPARAPPPVVRDLVLRDGEEPRAEAPEQGLPREQRGWTNEVREGGARPAIAPVAPAWFHSHTISRRTPL